MKKFLININLKTITKIVFLYCLLLCFFPLMLYAQQDNEQIFRQGNEFYQNKDFKKAAELYESVYNNGFESFALCYNLGNAYYRLNNTPKAILNYERAKKLQPDDEDLQHNMKMANLAVTDKIEPLPDLEFTGFFRDFVNIYSSGGWAIWAVVLLWMSLTSAALFILSKYRNIKKTGFYTAIVSAALFVVFVLISLQRKNYENKDFAIVFSPVSYVKTSPEEQSKDAFYLHSGTKVEIKEKIGKWSYIRIVDGKTGWLKSEDLEVI